MHVTRTDSQEIEGVTMKERDDVDLDRPDYGLEVVQQVDSHVRRGGRWRNLLTVVESEQAEAAEAGPSEVAVFRRAKSRAC